MRGFTFIQRALYLGGLLLLSGCVFSPENQANRRSQQEAQRQEALTRWAQCINQFSDRYKGAVNTIHREADAFCEGHQRDVLATFPVHLENQIAQLLSERSVEITTSHYVKTSSAPSWHDKQASHLDMIKTRLNEARRADL